MEGGKRRRGGDSLDEEVSEQLCPQKKKKEGKGGSGRRVRVGVESRQGVKKREKAHCASAAQPNKSGT